MPDGQSKHGSPSHDPGGSAERPQDVPAAGWKDIGRRVWGEISEKNMFLIAGGVTYAVLLALFPALAAFVAIYGLVLDAGQIEHQVSSLAGVLPDQILQLVAQQLHSLTSAPSSSLGIGVVIGLLLAIWSASRGMAGLMTGVNIAYEEEETRGFVKFNLIALLLTIGVIIGGSIAIALIGGLPAAVQAIGLGPVLKWLVLIVEWPVLMVLVLFGLAIIYRYAPDRDEPQWQWVTPGAITATVLWLVASIAFSIYAGNFGSYNQTYGSLAGAVVLMTWLYISEFVVLLGAAINAQSEMQTDKDTTRGPPEPMGRRGARVADVKRGRDE